jgi:hypothetical protein
MRKSHFTFIEAGSDINNSTTIHNGIIVNNPEIHFDEDIV